MSDETTLLPCPWCGGEVELKTYRDEGWTIECKNHDWPKNEGAGKIAPETIAADIQFCTWGLGDEARDALIAAWNARAYLNPDGLPAGLTLSEDGALLNWRGENYVRQSTLGGGECENVSDPPEVTALPEYSYDWQAIADDLNAALGEQPAKSGADALIRRARYMSHSIQGSLGRCLYRRKDVAEMEEVCELLMELANELSAMLGSGTCRNDWAEFGKFRCSECGLQVDSMSTGTTAPIPIAFCPRCGRKVKR